MTPHQLDHLVRRWRQTLLMREGGFTLGAIGFAAALLALWPGLGRVAWLLLVLLLMAAGTIRLWLGRWRRVDAGALTRHLDRTYPELEESSALWLTPLDRLTLLERLQLRRLAAAVASLEGNRVEQRPRLGFPPLGWLRVALVCGTVGAVLFGVTAVRAWHALATPRSPAAGVVTSKVPVRTIPTIAAAAPWPKILEGGLTITPPAYTGHPPRHLSGLGGEVEEGAKVVWSIVLDRPVRDARLVFGEAARATQPLQAGVDGKQLAGSAAVADTVLYHLAGTLVDGRAWNPPELYSLKVLKDHPPTVRIEHPDRPRMLIDPPAAGQPAPRVEVEVVAGDDYGVSAAHLVATVAKGSGEAVKFHEQTLPFEHETAEPGVPHGRRFQRTLDFGELGLEPGDELYFFVEVADNRQPVPNRTRSETRFLVLKGPETGAASAGRGVAGVNLVPQYFRSERQIIIDTEKLLADRPHITDAELRDRANDLGADQQLLRLRYGQFLGEDLEEGLGDHAELNLDPLQGTVPEQAAGPRAAASVAMRFRQEHDEQDREGGSDEQRAAGERPPSDVPLSAGQVVAPYVDQHDSQDKATLFDQSTKGTMREALDAMWAAERHLRVVQLDEALAPEHRALDILKDLQQSARAYVQHVGFEPPPLKVAERRLKGDVSDVPPRAARVDPLPPDDPAQADVRAALAELPWHHAEPLVLTTSQWDRLRAVQAPLGQAALRQPELFLPALQALRVRLTAGDAAATGVGPLPTVLEQALLRLLPPATSLPDVPTDPAPELDRAYRASLENAGSTEETNH